MDYKEKIRVNIPDLTKTMFLPVLARAIESAKSKPLMIDNIALNIISKVDREISEMASSIPELSRLEWIVRSLYIERIIKDFIERYPDGTVVNIGCGLDTIYERVDNFSGLWYDLDLSEVIEVRKLFMSESDKRKFISALFLDTGWFKKIDHNEHVMFVAGGVFYYFREKEIRRFLANLGFVFPACEMVLDVISPTGVRATNRILKKIFCGNNACLKWAVKDLKEILNWNPGFRLLGKFYTFKYEGLSLTAGNRISGWISDLLDIQYIIHIKVRFNYKHLKKRESVRADV
jgi:O-methyltransferase involved in polyketide biosynthesis